MELWSVEHVPRLDSDLTVQTSKHGAQWGVGANWERGAAGGNDHINK